ncbi:MAG: sodium:solute symporter family protein [Candidatus Brocadiia bacterium]
MLLKIGILAAYFAAVLILGHFARLKRKEDAAGYFLGGRSSSPLLLLATMAATNFSAFTVFGASGAGYRDGLAFLPIMAFGTGFMALSFLILGPRIRKLGIKHGLVTPAELIEVLYQSRPVAILFALVMVFFTIPYLAMQPYAGGMVLGSLFGTPPWLGASLVTGAIVLYTLRGGYRAVAWTDALQGLIMVTVMVGALVVVVSALGGWGTALHGAFSSDPALFARPGAIGTYSAGVWFGFLLLWFFCDPMFPQLFQRFYAARSDNAINFTALAYPAICLLVFIPPVLIGTMGRSVIPGLSGKEADAILPLLMAKVGGPAIAALVVTAGIAALMSTMDSQLLTLSSILGRDLKIGARSADPTGTGRKLVLMLAAVGLFVALTVDSSILDLGLMAFTGLAALFPTVFFGLYLARPSARAAAASIILGEATAVAAHFKLLPSFGLLPAVHVICVSVVAYVVVQALHRGMAFCDVSRRALLFCAAFAGIFIAALDFWRWGAAEPMFLGLPVWLWHFVALSAIQTALVAWWMRKEMTNDECGMMNKRAENSH